MSVTTELLKLERHAHATLKAMPELRKADETLEGQDKLDAMKRIQSEYGL